MARKGVVCVFSKAPVAGEVKTRLIPELGAEGAAQLYESLLASTLVQACASNVSSVHLYCFPDASHPGFQHYADKHELTLVNQSGSDLGERMHRAIEQELLEFDYAMVLGCDCPWLKSEELSYACEILETGKDAVLGPASDGGYYLIGLRQPQAQLFSAMTWGGSQVLAETRSRMQDSGLEWVELNEYRDVDLPEDLPDYERLLRQES